MINLLVQYLIKNSHLDLPGIGSLKCIKEASFWQDSQFVAPKEYIVLELVDVKPTKHFYSFLAEELNISIEQATVKFELFINEFMEKADSKLTFANLGVLYLKDKHFVWENSYNSNIYYYNLSLEIAQNNQQLEQGVPVKKDSWWIWAFVFLVIAASLIIYKFYFV